MMYMYKVGLCLLPWNLSRMNYEKNGGWSMSREIFERRITKLQVRIVASVENLQVYIHNALEEALNLS